MAFDFSFAISSVGTAISAAGFGFTIQQLRRTAKATEAVKANVSQLKNRMVAFDYASECVRASKTLQYASQLVKLRKWPEAASMILDGQSILHRLLANSGQKEEIRIEFSKVSEYLLAEVQELEEAEDKNIDYNSAKLMMTLRKHINLLDAQFIGTNLELYQDG